MKLRQLFGKHLQWWTRPMTRYAELSVGDIVFAGVSVFAVQVGYLHWGGGGLNHRNLLTSFMAAVIVTAVIGVLAHSDRRRRRAEETQRGFAVSQRPMDHSPAPKEIDVARRG
jgi:hypothetical protein